MSANCKIKTKKLLLLDQNELALYNIQQELEELNSDISLIPLLADIQDRSRLREIVSAWLPRHSLSRCGV